MADEEYIDLIDIIVKRAEDQEIISDEHGTKTSYISLWIFKMIVQFVLFYF